MKTKLSLAVAAALLAGASSANAGIMIPAGDWTLDIGGVVNAYYTSTRASGDAVSALGGVNDAGKTTSNITTGLLPNYLSVSGKTRQNDLDVGFTISIQPGASTTTSGKQSAQQENRQAFLTFGDKSWGSIKLGKDLGIYASDAILNDMTLLGVGSAAGFLAGNTTTLGRIGTGFMYADWKSQVAYSSPNWNGFSFTGGVTQAWNASNSSGRGGASPAFEGKASYEWAGDFGGKAWVSGITQKVKGINSSAAGIKSGFVKTGAAAGSFQAFSYDAAAVAGTSDHANAWDIGATVNVAGFGLTGYYGQGEGMGTTVQLAQGFDSAGQSRSSQDWYVQGTYTIPTVGTKIGVSYGESTLDGNAIDTFNDKTNRMWTIGAYHPITKHLNLVAEYSDVKGESNNKASAGSAFAAGTSTTAPTAFSAPSAAGTASGTTKTISLGAILFF
jgi:predicted porin